MNIVEDASNLVVELLSAEEIDGDREIGLTCAGFESLPILSFVFDGLFYRPLVELESSAQ